MHDGAQRCNRAVFLYAELEHRIGGASRRWPRRVILKHRGNEERGFCARKFRFLRRRREGLGCVVVRGAHGEFPVNESVCGEVVEIHNPQVPIGILLPDPETEESIDAFVLLERDQNIAGGLADALHRHTGWSGASCESKRDTHRDDTSVIHLMPQRHPSPDACGRVRAAVSGMVEGMVRSQCDCRLVTELQV